MDHESKMLAVDREIQGLEAELQSIQASLFSTGKSDAEIKIDKDIFIQSVLPVLAKAGWNGQETDVNALKNGLKKPTGLAAITLSSFPQTIGAWAIRNGQIEQYLLLYYDTTSVECAIIHPTTMSITTFKGLPNAVLWDTKARPTEGADYGIYVQAITSHLPATPPANPTASQTPTPATPPPPPL
jgi:hypothetical protein